jgi:hypothetical protein
VQRFLSHLDDASFITVSQSHSSHPH